MSIVEEINEFYYRMAIYELEMMNGTDYYHGLSYNSLLYLNIIDQMEACTVSKIAEILHITKSAVTVKVNELVKQGLVVKEQSTEDKRVFYLRLNEDMDKIMKNYDHIFAKIEERLKEKYRDEELETFGKILQEICKMEWRGM